MELVLARSLSRVLAEDGPMPAARAAEMGTVLLEALGSAHAAGIVHRDVKPGNVLITAEGRTVLTDFGIATVDGDPGLTQAGMVMGTPGFCSPERIRGAPASPASDLWSLGATLYAAVQGRGPFEGQGSAMAVLAHIVHGDPPPATSAGPLGPVIAALLSRNPAARPDAAAARQMLAAACDGAQARDDAGKRLAGQPAAGPRGDRAAAQPSAPPPVAGQSVADQSVADQSVADQSVAGQAAAGQAAGTRPGTPAAVPSGTPSVGPRRPGRHRRGLLLGGGGAAAR